ncbi:MAG TPA: protein translocase subunit SecF [Firmicutes bacterium]|nr:protein translocase subunit SecF [Bacillota bacterium]
MRFDFVKMFRVAGMLSVTVIVVGLIFMALPGRGLRWGLDFTGGVLLQAHFAGEAPNESAVRELLALQNITGPVIQRSTNGHDLLVRMGRMTNEQRQAVVAALKAKFGEFQVVRLDDISGSVSSELTKATLLALLVANLGMMLYIALRFEIKFAVAAIIALVHDVLVTVGMAAVAGAEVNRTFVAALLTIIGYSINDTIVVYDRIRENLKTKKKGESLASIVNRSINETLTRSINTSLTTLLAVAAIYLFGGTTTKDFAFALLVGITAGTYSSIFIASPIWLLWKTKEG